MHMNKTGYITARVEPKLKESAGRVLKKIGVSTSDAITMFLRQVVMRQHAPDIAEDRVEPLPDLGEAA